jgi:hypothetical protein
MILVERRMEQVTTGDRKKSKVDCLEFFTTLYGKVKDDMRVSTLQIPASIAKLDKELTTIKEIVAAIDGWPRKGFETRR